MGRRILGIFAAVSAVASALYIFDFWESRSASSRPNPTAVGEVPQSTDKGIPGPPAGNSSPTSLEQPTRRSISEPGASGVETLLNRGVVPQGPGIRMAIALDGDASDAELLATALFQGSSTKELRIVPGLFKPGFKEKGYLRAVYGGDTSILAKSGALAVVDRVLVGRVERSCGPTGQIDEDLVTCDFRLAYKTFDRRGAIAGAGQVASVGAGLSEDEARDRAVERLVQQHGKKITEGS